MAGEGRKVFSDGEVLSAADVNDYLMDQAVMRFADSAARSSAIGTPTEGMVSYLDDTNDVEVYDGSQWVNFTGDITNITAGTGLTGGGSEGAVTLNVDYTEVVENVVTTQGDLIVGGSGGAIERLGIGAASTVLTSDGSAISWAAGGGGGGVIVYEVPANTSLISEETLEVGLSYSFTFPGTGFAVAVEDTNNESTEFNSDTDITPTVEISRIYFNNTTGGTLFVNRSNPVAGDTSSITVTTITTTQSVTLTQDTLVACIGGGGGGGGTNDTVSAHSPGAGGGGSGFVDFGILSAGTYTATIGAGGSGGAAGANNGATGGTTSIGTVSAAGGNGGNTNVDSDQGGAGGSGGSGGGGGASDFQDIGAPQEGGAGGVNGANGSNGDTPGGGVPGGVGASGSGVKEAGIAAVLNSFNYQGGDGGTSKANSGGTTNGPSGTLGKGGGGAGSKDNATTNYAGGNGGAGVIVLVEVG